MKISGKYTHYKGKSYEVYCPVRDENGNCYVLYRQCYADGGPYDMFFETTEVEGKRVRRFCPDDAERLATPERYVQALKGMENSLHIRHSETEQSVVIAHIDAENQVFVRILGAK